MTAEELAVRGAILISMLSLKDQIAFFESEENLLAIVEEYGDNGFLAFTLSFLKNN
jgi:hypothetical protein